MHNANDNFLGIDDIISNPNYKFNPFQTIDIDDDSSPYLGIDISCNYLNETEFLEQYSNVKNASTLSLNIDGLSNKINELRDFTSIFRTKGFHFDIIGLQEINQIYDVSSLSLPNYSQLVYSKRTSRQKGGVGFYISSNLSFKISEELSVFEEGILESLFLEVEFSKGNKILVGNIYRCPNQTLEQTETFLHKLHTLLDTIENKRCKCIMMGDFNLCLLKHESYRPTQEFIEQMFSFGYLQLINYPTRISHHANHHTSASLIDQIWTNILKDYYTSGIIKTFLSDHFPIYTFLDIQSKKCQVPKTVSSRDFSQNNMENFKIALEATLFDSVSQEPDTQASYDRFHSIFFDLYERSFPIRNVRFNKNVHKIEKWMTKGLLISRKTKISLGNEKALLPCDFTFNRFKEYKNLYNKLLRLAKKQYYSDLLINAQGDIKKSWGVIREATGLSHKQNSLTDFLEIQGNEIKGDFNLAQKFNEHFSNIATNIQDNIAPTVRPPESYIENLNHYFLFPTVTPDMIKETFSELKVKKSTDFSGLSTHFLKNVIDIISTPLSHIFNKSMESGVVPEQCKIAKVSPVFKKGGNEGNVNDYRPISVLSIFSKILEKIISNSLKDFLVSNEILSSQQFGFQNSNSTYHPMMHLLNKVGQAMNNHEYTLAIFCDLSKAFDLVPINGLLKKLEKIGIHDNQLKWFESYLFRRRQFVKIRNEDSNYRYITSGVPQGSILGPILFLIYINDLTNSTLLYVLLFADDTTLLASGKNLNELIEFVNFELRKISQWFRANKMLLHPIKTKFTVFCTEPENIPWDEINIYLDENDIDTDMYDINLRRNISYINHRSEVPAIKFLGVYFDPKT